MKNSSLKECLEASENLIKVLDNADRGTWCWKELGKILGKAEKLNKRIKKLVENEELGKAEDTASYVL